MISFIFLILSFASCGKATRATEFRINLDHSIVAKWLMLVASWTDRLEMVRWRLENDKLIAT